MSFTGGSNLDRSIDEALDVLPPGSQMTSLAADWFGRYFALADAIAAAA